MIIATSMFCSCTNDSELTNKTFAKVHDFRLANSSDHDVYGIFQFGDHKGRVGVVGAGKFAEMAFMPFSHTGKATVTFECYLENEEKVPCAIGEVDVSEHYPVGKFYSVTTVFTYKPDNTVELSFSIMESINGSLLKKEIAVGNISKKSNNKINRTENASALN